MKDLKYKVLQCIPFMGFNNDFKKNVSRDQRINNFISSSIFIFLGSLYIYSSFSFSAPMFSKKWIEKRQYYIQEIEEGQRESYIQRFNRLDKNQDGVIDFMEFSHQ